MPGVGETIEACVTVLSEEYPEGLDTLREQRDYARTEVRVLEEQLAALRAPPDWLSSFKVPRGTWYAVLGENGYPIKGQFVPDEYT